MLGCTVGDLISIQPISGNIQLTDFFGDIFGDIFGDDLGECLMGGWCSGVCLGDVRAML